MIRLGIRGLQLYRVKTGNNFTFHNGIRFLIQLNMKSSGLERDDAWIVEHHIYMNTTVIKRLQSRGNVDIIKT